MVNKFLVVFFAFGAFVFVVVAIGMTWITIAHHEPIRRAIRPDFLMILMAWQALRIAVSRAKYDPKGPPPDPLENFHIDF